MLQQKPTKLQHPKKNEPNATSWAERQVRRQTLTPGLTEPMMTMPHERTKAVVETRKLLQLLASSEHVASHKGIHAIAVRLPRHYPLDIHLDISAVALPGVWATPENWQVGAVATFSNMGADDDDESASRAARYVNPL
ncbi:BPSL0761 family protein [Paraburkholderia kirstenboschensis]|uniref:BPSL0761 family protein n=1 Tax=Paraburkholderia kirstenboschensis TaxID=1245436 RepID=A0ABZ0EIR8_9BURK|nr:BPSL0761 family protein [Paraburkholderia kirstenboschensis]WOD17125.1 BPSL0761 family protein [Paraburkholderia kirstenboschensis]